MLVRGGELRPVGLGEGRRFALWELASLAELALGETVEPEGLTALTGVYDAVRAAGLNGVRLETHWCWQEAVRYYLARGMWVAHRKHGLTLEWVTGRPRYEVVGSDEELAFRVWLDGQWVPLLVAGRSGGRLVLRQVEPPGRGASWRAVRTCASPPWRRSRCIWPCGAGRWSGGPRSGNGRPIPVTSGSRRGWRTRSAGSSGWPGRTDGGW